MAIIITQQEFNDRLLRLERKIESIDSECEIWGKLVSQVPKIKKLWFRDKIYAVKHLNWLESNIGSMEVTEKACAIQLLELLKKLILHKRENPVQKRTWRSILKKKK